MTKTKTTINGINFHKFNLEDKHFEFEEEDFLGRSENWCGVCKGKGYYYYQRKKQECDECGGDGLIFADGDHDHHECGDWEIENEPEIELEGNGSATVRLGRTCHICHQYSKLVWSLIDKYIMTSSDDSGYHYEIRPRNIIVTLGVKGTKSAEFFNAGYLPYNKYESLSADIGDLVEKYKEMI